MQLRPKRSWTPRYIRDRLLIEYYMRRHPDEPWWTRYANRHLEGLLRSSDTCLEWGSGRSTVWLASRVGQLRSVEHDPDWYERVRALLAERGGDLNSVQLLDAASDNGPHTTPYVRVIDEFAEGELDVCIVDGEHRAACAVAAVPKLTAGGLLVVDDVNWFLDHPTHAPRSRFGKGPLDDGWRQFESLVADWRCVWTTDGTIDTAIWIKPGNS